MANCATIPPPNTFSTKSIQDATQWLNQCRLTHVKCRPKDGVTLPHRVLDVGKLSPESASSVNRAMHELIEVRLKENSTSPDYSDYCCLSHCWGSIRPECITNKDTLLQNKAGIPWSTLPKTFQDAIIFTRVLGVRYLWIDSLCWCHPSIHRRLLVADILASGIVQDDSVDWAAEAAKMADIYSGSLLTLAAAASYDGNGGMDISPGDVIRGREVQGLSQAGLGQFQGKLFVRTDPSKFSHEQRSLPLVTRAWVYQERLLSTRTLHFAESELMWECATTTACQCSPSYALDDDDLAHRKGRYPKFHHLESLLRSSGDQAIIQARWRQMVTEYSHLHLSHESDRLQAISGLAAQMAKYRPNDRYVAGVWTNSLLSDLLWVRNHTLRLETLLPKSSAPSWSWAAPACGVKFRGATHLNQRTAQISIRESVSQLAGDSGQATSDCLVVQGKVYDAVLRYDPDQNFHQYKYDIVFEGMENVVIHGVRAEVNGYQTTCAYFEPDYFLEAEGFRGYCPNGERVRCILLTDDLWLVVKYLEDDKAYSGPPRCQRIGMGSMSWEKVRVHDPARRDGTVLVY